MSPPADAPSGIHHVPRARLWHRRFLAAGAGGLLLAIPLCYMFLFAAIPAAACFLASLGAAVALWSRGRSPGDSARERLIDGLTTGVVLLVTGSVLTILANTELYFLWLVLAGLLVAESLILAPPWRARGAVQLAVLVAALVGVPLGVAAHRPATAWSAILRNDPRHLRLLLAGGADPNARIDGDPLLGLALGFGRDIRLVQMLLSHGANPNARHAGDDAPVLVGAPGAPAQAIELLLDAGADPNAADRRGRTAVFAATHSGNRDVLELLARRGARLDTRDVSGRTALFEAGSRDTAELLLRLGVDLHATDVRGRSALFVAVAQSAPVAGLLVERGLSVNSGDARGRTPLFELAEGGGGLEESYRAGGYGYRTAEWLIASGADLAARDADGKTAADRAEARGRAALAGLLRPHGKPRRADAKP